MFCKALKWLLYLYFQIDARCMPLIMSLIVVMFSDTVYIDDGEVRPHSFMDAEGNLCIRLAFIINGLIITFLVLSTTTLIVQDRFAMSYVDNSAQRLFIGCIIHWFFQEISCIFDPIIDVKPCNILFMANYCLTFSMEEMSHYVLYSRWETMIYQEDNIRRFGEGMPTLFSDIPNIPFQEYRNKLTTAASCLRHSFALLVFSWHLLLFYIQFNYIRESTYLSGRLYTILLSSLIHHVLYKTKFQNPIYRRKPHSIHIVSFDIHID